MTPCLISSPPKRRPRRLLMSQLSSRARVELAKAALSRIGLESPELRPYQDEPAQMPSIRAVGNRLVTVLLKPSSRTPRALISNSTRVEIK